MRIAKNCPEPQHWTFDDICALPDDGTRREILDGVMYVMESPNIDHQRAISRIARKIGGWVLQEKRGELFISPLDVVLKLDTAVQPDALFVATEHMSLAAGGKNIQGAPDLVIEVLSESNFRHDLLRKRRKYAQHRIPEYWIVDPWEKSVTVLKLDGMDYRQEEPAANDQPIPTAVLGGLPVKAGELFED